ncbi:MAG TPA: hypothetical protein VH639_22265 [Bryobacteraceae bacterium]|jgi:hypothetical protein
MIDHAELLRLANEVGLEARIVEKDYVLGWLLAGVFRDPALAAAWARNFPGSLQRSFHVVIAANPESLGASSKFSLLSQTRLQIFLMVG